MKKSKLEKPRSIRFESRDLMLAKDLNIDISEICRKALKKAIKQESQFFLNELRQSHRSFDPSK